MEIPGDKTLTHGGLPTRRPGDATDSSASGAWDSVSIGDHNYMKIIIQPTQIKRMITSSGEFQHPGMSYFAGHPQGPIPDLHAPAPDECREARLHLKNLKHGEPIPSEDIRTILHETVTAVRQGIIKTGQEMGLSESEAFTPERLSGMCILAEEMAYYRLMDTGISPFHMKSHEVSKLGGKHYHAFLVAEMPDKKTYLVDPSFRQFFVDEAHATNNSNRPGEFLRSAPEGAEMAYNLIKDGYIELTHETAQLYFKAFEINRGDARTILIAQSSLPHMDRMLIDDQLPPMAAD